MAMSLFETALESSARIIKQAMEEIRPDYIVSMVSGGRDSAAFSRKASAIPNRLLKRPHKHGSFWSLIDLFCGSSRPPLAHPNLPIARRSAANN